MAPRLRLPTRLAVVLALASALAACAGTTPPLATPTGLRVVPGAGRQAVVAWTGVIDARLDHYTLHHRVGSGPLAPLLDLPATASAHLAARLEPGQVHAFAIEAVGADGRSSGLGAEVSATILPAPQTAVPLATDGAPNGYYEFLPPGYGDGVARPLLVFWHGLGEDGDGVFLLDQVLKHGPPKLIQQGAWPAARDFLVLSPQNVQGCPTAAQVHAYLAWAQSRYQVDPRRIFLTGLSCGAIGIWDYLGSYTGAEVAAVVLVAGDPGSAWARAGGCSGLGQVALWAFHGDADPVVDIAPEQAVMSSLLACPQPPRRDAIFTVVAGGGHDVWTDAYAGTTSGDVFAWLAAHPRP